MTFNIMTLSIRGLFATLSTKDTQNKSTVQKTIMLNGSFFVMLNVVPRNVVVLRVVAPLSRA
jgi:hypothetical protein